MNFNCLPFSPEIAECGMWDDWVFVNELVERLVLVLVVMMFEINPRVKESILFVRIDKWFNLFFFIR